MTALTPNVKWKVLNRDGSIGFHFGVYIEATTDGVRVRMLPSGVVIRIGRHRLINVEPGDWKS